MGWGVTARGHGVPRGGGGGDENILELDGCDGCLY